MAKRKQVEIAVEASTATFLANHQVRFDGDIYQRGEEIEMTEVHAAPLVANGTLTRIARTTAEGDAV